MIEGEKFSPTDIEEIVEKTIKEFIKEIRRLNFNDYHNLCDQIIAKTVSLPRLLDNVAEKIYTTRR